MNLYNVEPRKSSQNVAILFTRYSMFN